MAANDHEEWTCNYCEILRLNKLGQGRLHIKRFSPLYIYSVNIFPGLSARTFRRVASTELFVMPVGIVRFYP